MIYALREVETEFWYAIYFKRNYTLKAKYAVTVRSINYDGNLKQSRNKYILCPPCLWQLQWLLINFIAHFLLEYSVQFRWTTVFIQLKQKIHILNFRKWDNCCIVPNKKINTVIITGIYGCEIERVLFQGISGKKRGNSQNCRQDSKTSGLDSNIGPPKC